MNHYDAKVFGDNVRGVFDALGGRAPGDKGLEMWFHALKQFPMEHVTDALDEWTRKMPRVPTPAGNWPSSCASASRTCSSAR